MQREIYSNSNDPSPGREQHDSSSELLDEDSEELQATPVRDWSKMIFARLVGEANMSGEYVAPGLKTPTPVPIKNEPEDKVDTGEDDSTPRSPSPGDEFQHSSAKKEQIPQLELENGAQSQEEEKVADNEPNEDASSPEECEILVAGPSPAAAANKQVPPPPPPSKDKVAGLKQLFESKAREFKPSYQPLGFSGIGSKIAKLTIKDADGPGTYAFREQNAPELLSIREKKHLFERKIRESRRWDDEIEEVRTSLAHERIRRYTLPSQLSKF